jgi:hypothetical protein
MEKGTPRSLTLPSGPRSPTPLASLPETAPDPAFQATLPDAARVTLRGRSRRRLLGRAPRCRPRRLPRPLQTPPSGPRSLTPPSSPPQAALGCHDEMPLPTPRSAALHSRPYLQIRPRPGAAPDAAAGRRLSGPRPSTPSAPAPGKCYRTASPTPVPQPGSRGSPTKEGNTPPTTTPPPGDRHLDISE